MWLKTFNLLMMGITSVSAGMLTAIMGKIILDGWRDIKQLKSKP